MILNIIRKSDRAAQLPRLLGGRTTQVFAMHCIRIFSNPKWINSIFQFLKRTHLYVNCFFFFSSLEVTLGVDFGIFTLCLVYKRALKKCSIIVLVHTRSMSNSNVPTPPVRRVFVQVDIVKLANSAIPKL